MDGRWTTIALRNLLSRTETRIELIATEVYREVTVRLWGKGVTLRRETLGSEIKADRRVHVRTGQFILSRIDARNGAFGLIPPELDGAVVSGDFPVFDVRMERLLPEFLGWLARTNGFVDLCRAASEGTTNRVRLKEDRFLAAEIPLPALAEQRRIVAKIDQLAAKIAEARGLHSAADADAAQILPAEATRVYGQLGAQHPVRSFGDFDPHVTSGPRSWAARYVESGGFRFYRAQDVLPAGRLAADSKVFIEPPATQQGATARLSPGDLMIVITGATVGRVALYPADAEPGYVSQHVAICRLPQTALDGKFVLWGLLNRDGQAQLLGQRYGQGKPGLNLTNIRSVRLPVPPLAEQRRIVAYLDDLQAKVDRLKALQAQTAAELDALLPAILDKAFKGEL